jgi:PadR family transcriptional regulator PadR
MAPITPPTLGEFELLVLLAVMQLGDEAYPLAIAEQIEASTKRAASRPAVLITLNRLEDKGLLTSRHGDPTPVRGGRSKRFFLPKPLAVQAVRQSLQRIQTMAQGLDLLIQPKLVEPK